MWGDWILLDSEDGLQILASVEQLAEIARRNANENDLQMITTNVKTIFFILDGSNPS